MYGDAASDASTLTTYRFRINDNDGGRSGSPEPAYNETKASILRRRNTMAKMIQEEEQAAIQVLLAGTDIDVSCLLRCHYFVVVFLEHP